MPALLARREDLPEARAEERQIVGRKVGDRPERQQNVPQDRAGIAGRAGKRAGTRNVGFPYCVKPTRVVGTR